MGFWCRLGFHDFECVWRGYTGIGARYICKKCGKEIIDIF